MTEPTDAELIALLGDRQFSTIGAVREALRRWGTPPAGAGEHKPGCPALGGYGHGVGECCCGTTPQPTQAQAGAVPLTVEQRSDIATAAAGFNWTDDYVEAIDYVIDGVESLHGIKGGQHGVE